jgi:hypothetical protein
VDGYLRASGAEYRRAEHSGRVVFELADGRRLATGDARGVGDAESLNLAHPMVREAIDYARQWSGGGALTLRLVADSRAELAGKAGVLCVVLADYAGFEPVQRLVAAAVVDGMPVEPSLAADLLELEACDEPASDVAVDAQLLDDAVDEAVFVDQRQVEEGEQKHFERAIGQLERFVEDKLLVRRRDRTATAEKLRAARARRDEVVGSTARERVEAEILQLAGLEEDLESKIGALESRDDEVYKKCRDEYHELRYRAPVVRRLFQTSFRIARPKAAKLC